MSLGDSCEAADGTQLMVCDCLPSVQGILTPQTIVAISGAASAPTADPQPVSPHLSVISLPSGATAATGFWHSNGFAAFAPTALPLAAARLPHKIEIDCGTHRDCYSEAGAAADAEGCSVHTS